MVRASTRRTKADGRIGYLPTAIAEPLRYDGGDHAHELFSITTPRPLLSGGGPFLCGAVPDPVQGDADALPVEDADMVDVVVTGVVVSGGERLPGPAAEADAVAACVVDEGAVALGPDAQSFRVRAGSINGCASG